MTAKAQAVAPRLIRQTKVDPETGCWTWTGYRNPNGYVRISVEGRVLYAHRVAYETFREPIPSGLQIDHLCRNRACVNPDHLEVVSHRENSLRGNGAPARHFRKTHCVNGHAYTSENTLWEGGGKWRRCKTCRMEQRGRA